MSTVTPRIIAMGLAVLVVAAMALDTTYKDADAPKVSAGGREAFEPAEYGVKTFPRAFSALEEKAQPLPRLVAALRKDLGAAGERFGHREGTSPYSFAAKGEGVGGAVKSGLIPVRVAGVPKTTTVSLQVGPAINGTSIRDAAGFISFNQFVNQVDFADAATALNDQVKAKVLESIEPKSLNGKNVSFTGAFTALGPTVVTITPVKLEVGA